MKIQLPDGHATTLDQLKADVEAAQAKFVSSKFCFTWPTVLGLLNKIEDLSNQKAASVTEPTKEIASSNSLISRTESRQVAR